MHGVKQDADTVVGGVLNGIGFGELNNLMRNVIIDPGFNLVTGLADEALGKRFRYQ